MSNKNIIPEGTPLCLAEPGTIWHWAAERLEELENDLMISCRQGVMKLAEGRAWITNNIEPLEKRFEEDNERSIELLNDILDLELPIPMEEDEEE